MGVFFVGGFKGSVGRCMATTPSSFLLTTNKQNLLPYCPRQKPQQMRCIPRTVSGYKHENKYKQQQDDSFLSLFHIFFQLLALQITNLLLSSLPIVVQPSVTT